MAKLPLYKKLTSYLKKPRNFSLFLTTATRTRVAHKKMSKLANLILILMVFLTGTLPTSTCACLPFTPLSRHVKNFYFFFCAIFLAKRLNFQAPQFCDANCWRLFYRTWSGSTRLMCTAIRSFPCSWFFTFCNFFWFIYCCVLGSLLPFYRIRCTLAHSVAMLISHLAATLVSNFFFCTKIFVCRLFFFFLWENIALYWRIVSLVLPFLHKTEWFLSPIVVMLLLYIMSIVLGFNLTIMMANFYFAVWRSSLTLPRFYTPFVLQVVLRRFIYKIASEALVGVWQWSLQRWRPKYFINRENFRPFENFWQGDFLKNVNNIAAYCTWCLSSSLAALRISEISRHEIPPMTYKKILPN